jgi:O-antigen/teichoic acid export membrane protein
MAILNGRSAFKISASFMDQALFAGTHFALNVILASTTTQADYGRFSFVYALIALTSALHAAFVGEAVSVFWRDHEARRVEFLANAHFINILFIATILAVALLSGAALYFSGDFSLIEAIAAVWLAIALPTAWLFRHLSFAQLKPWRAAGQSGIYAVGTLAGVFLFLYTGSLTALTALVALAGGATAVCLYGFCLYPVKAIFQIDEVGRSAILTSVHHGIWSAPSAAMGWFAANIFLLTMPLLGSAAEAGRLKAFLNILLPFQQVLQGISQIALPLLAREVAVGGKIRLRRVQILYLAGGIVGSLSVTAVIFVFGADIYQALYGGNYTLDTRLMLSGAALPIAMGVIAVSRTILRAHRKPQAVLMSYIIGIISVGLIAIPLGTASDAAGALFAMTAIHAGIMMFIFLQTASLFRQLKITREPVPGEDA